MKFLIKRQVQYTEALEIEADSKADALTKSEDMEFDRWNDDTVVNETAYEVSDEQ